MSTPDQWTIFAVAAVCAALVLLAAAFAGAGRFGELPEPVVDEFVPELPPRPLTPSDLRDARFAIAGRGYSRAQVDQLLARAAAQWDADRRPARRADPESEPVLAFCDNGGPTNASKAPTGAENEVARWQR